MSDEFIFYRLSEMLRRGNRNDSTNLEHFDCLNGIRMYTGKHLFKGISTSLYPELLQSTARSHGRKIAYLAGTYLKSRNLKERIGSNYQPTKLSGISARKLMILAQIEWKEYEKTISENKLLKQRVADLENICNLCTARKNENDEPKFGPDDVIISSQDLEQNEKLQRCQIAYEKNAIAVLEHHECLSVIRTYIEEVAFKGFNIPENTLAVRSWVVAKNVVRLIERYLKRLDQNVFGPNLGLKFQPKSLTTIAAQKVVVISGTGNKVCRAMERQNPLLKDLVVDLEEKCIWCQSPRNGKKNGKTDVGFCHPPEKKIKLSRE